MCTCKGFRGFGQCSHCVAVHAQFYPDEYDRDALENLLEEVSEKKRAAHRPKKMAGPLSEHPHGDSSDEGGAHIEPLPDLWETSEVSEPDE